MKLLGSIKSNTTEDENGENMLHLEINEVILVHYSIVNYDYQQDSSVLHIVPNKTFGKLLDISTTDSIFLETFNSEFLVIN